jgi:acetyl-CoA C-acetyltransferase
MNEVYIIDAKRTAIGNLNGSLSKIAAHKMGANLINNLVSRNNLDSALISQVIMGQVLSAGQGQNPARQAAILGNLPNHVSGFTINQVCGSGLKAVALAANSIMLGESDIIIAGGQENMSMSPHAVHMRNGHKFGDAKLLDLMLIDGLVDAFGNYSMGITAENLAKKYNISRMQQDEFALLSTEKAQVAQRNNRFNDEILPIELKTKEAITIFNKDESIRNNTNLQILEKLRPAFLDDGSVTAGNSSSINDGAAALLLMSKSKALSLGLKPLAKIISYAVTGVDPSIMGIGPVSATQQALKKADWNLKDVDLIEANEAFAAQVLAVSSELNWDLSKVNVNGGAIALGHPIGASGARLLVTLLHEMNKRDAKKGLVTLCIGGGMGISMCVQR